VQILLFFVLGAAFFQSLVDLILWLLDGDTQDYFMGC
jgi:hypothetical protein